MSDDNDLEYIMSAIAGLRQKAEDADAEAAWLRERAERAERDRDMLRSALDGMIESYDILHNEVMPPGVGRDAVRGAFIGAIDRARAVTKQPATGKE